MSRPGILIKFAIDINFFCDEYTDSIIIAGRRCGTGSRCGRFQFFDHDPDLKVNVFDRPWNREVTLPGDNFVRCTDWAMIKQNVELG